MVTVLNEIEDAMRRLRLGQDDIALVPDEAGRVIVSALESHFVTTPGRRWWWEDFCFSTTSIHFLDQRGFTRIPIVVPDPDERVWFVVEETLLPSYPVYESTPRVVEQVIGECYGFEYYVVAKDLRWLVCENHHNCIIAIGTEVESRLRGAAPNPPQAP